MISRSTRPRVMTLVGIWLLVAGTMMITYSIASTYYYEFINSPAVVLFASAFPLGGPFGQQYEIALLILGPSYLTIGSYILRTARFSRHISVGVLALGIVMTAVHFVMLTNLELLYKFIFVPQERVSPSSLLNLILHTGFVAPNIVGIYFLNRKNVREFSARLVVRPKFL